MRFQPNALISNWIARAARRTQSRPIDYLWSIALQVFLFAISWKIEGGPAALFTLIYIFCALFTALAGFTQIARLLSKQKVIASA
jgi:hypothetical protein